MRRMPTARLSRPSLTATLALALVLAGGLAGGLGGCAKSQSLSVAGAHDASAQPWPATAPNIEISNFNGRVDLIVDDKLTAPSVIATGWSCGEKVDARESDTLAQMNVAAAFENGVYRIVANAHETLPAGVGINLAVRVPSSGAITVYNRGGPVKIVGATAGVQVENGRGPQTDDTCWLDESHDSWIQLRTHGPIDQPVALVTDHGDVAIILGPNAKGAFDLQAPDGEVRANARVGTFDQLKRVHNNLTARYNGGTNPVLLRSDHGNARALMIEKPENYTMAMWW